MTKQKGAVRHITVEQMGHEKAKVVSFLGPGNRVRYLLAQVLKHRLW